MYAVSINKQDIYQKLSENLLDQRLVNKMYTDLCLIHFCLTDIQNYTKDLV